MARAKKGAAQAQAQANKQQEVSKQESLSLVQNLLRVSVFHTAYLRGLFPEHKFQATTMRNLENMKIRMLAPTCPETKRMNEWIEKDIHEALTAGYLHSLHFCVCKDREGTDLIEQYTYTFTYTTDGRACLDVRISDRKKGKSVKNKAPPDPESIRCQVVRMLRMLVEITSTLDRMPEERYLLMKVEYTKETPEDFGTPNFAPAGPEQLMAHYERSPFSISAGDVETGHHMVSLRVHSILDLDDEDADQDGDDASLDAEGDGQPAGEEDAGDPPGRAGAPKAGVKHPVAGKTGKPGHAAGEDDGGDAGRHKGDRGAAAAERGGDEVMLSPDSSPPAGVGTSPPIGKLHMDGSQPISPMLTAMAHQPGPSTALHLSGVHKATDDAPAGGRRTPKLGGTPAWLHDGGDDKGEGKGGGLPPLTPAKEPGGKAAAKGAGAHGRHGPSGVEIWPSGQQGAPGQGRAAKQRAKKQAAVAEEDGVKRTPEQGKRVDARMHDASDEDGLVDTRAGGAPQGMNPSQGPVIVCSQGKRRGAAVRSPIEQVKRFKGGYGRMASMRCT